MSCGNETEVCVIAQESSDNVSLIVDCDQDIIEILVYDDEETVIIQIDESCYTDADARAAFSLTLLPGATPTYDGATGILNLPPGGTGSGGSDAFIIDGSMISNGGATLTVSAFAGRIINGFALDGFWDTGGYAQPTATTLVWNNGTTFQAGQKFLYLYK